MHWVSIESREEEDIQWFSGWFVRYFFREKNRRERERERIFWVEGGALSGVFWLEIFLEGISFSGRVS